MHPVALEFRLPHGGLLPSVALAIIGLGLALSAWGRAGRVRVALSAGAGALLLGALAAARGLAWGTGQLVVVPSFGACVAGGVLLAWLSTHGAERRWRVPARYWERARVLAFVGALVGSSVALLATRTALPGPWGWLPQRAGLSVPGAGLGVAVVGSLLLWRRTRLRLSAVDRLAWMGLVVAAAASFGRFLTGSDFGPVLGAGAPKWLVGLGAGRPWNGAERLLGEGSPAWVAQLDAGLLPPGVTGAIPVHPVALYQAFLLMGLAVGLALWGRRRLAPGVLLRVVGFWVGTCWLLFGDKLAAPAEVLRLGSHALPFQSVVGVALWGLVLLDWHRERGAGAARPRGAAQGAARPIVRSAAARSGP